MAYIKLVDDPLAREIHDAITVKRPYPHIKGDAIDGYMLYGHVQNGWELTRRAFEAVSRRWKDEYHAVLAFETHALPFATLLATTSTSQGRHTGLIFQPYPVTPVNMQPYLPGTKVFPVGYSIKDGSEIEWLLKECLPSLNVEAPQVLVMIDADTWPNRGSINRILEDETSPEILALTRTSLGKQPNIVTRYLSALRR